LPALAVDKPDVHQAAETLLHGAQGFGQRILFAELVHALLVGQEIQGLLALLEEKGHRTPCVGCGPGGAQKVLGLQGMPGDVIVDEGQDAQGNKGDHGQHTDGEPPDAAVVEQGLSRSDIAFRVPEVGPDLVQYRHNATRS